MQLWNIVNQLDITAYARERFTPDDLPNTLNQLLPTREITGVRSRTARRSRNRTVAMYRAYNAETPIGSRNAAVETTEVLLPPVGQKLSMTEWDYLWLQFATTGDAGLDAIIEQAYDDVNTSVDAIRNRIELACGDLLTDGKFTFLANENGLALEADYALLPEQLGSASASWASTTTDIVTMETDWLETFRGVHKANPTDAVVSTVTRNRMMRNESYRKIFWAGTASTGPNLTLPQLDQVRASLGLPPLYVYDHQLDVDGSSVYIIPQEQYILVDRASLGETQYGTTAESLELVSSKAVDFTLQDAPGLIAAVYKDADPVTGWTKVSAVALPVLADSTAILSKDTTP